MKINATEPISSPVMPDSQQGAPAAADIDTFASLLYSQPTSSAEETALSWIKDQSLSVTQAMGSALSVASGDTPEAMLKAQSQLKNIILEVDLTAKVAGQLSQGINKLVNMQ